MVRIAIDMDEVLADTLGAQLRWFRERYGYTWTRQELLGRRLFDDLVAPAHARAHEAVIREGSFFGELPVMPGAVEVVRRMAERYEVFVASAAVPIPCSLLPKVRWLERHFPFIPDTHVVLCGEKSLLDADYLLDDNAHRFPRFRGQGVIFDAPHNAGVEGYPRVASWGEVATLFLEGPPAPPVP